MGFSFKKLSRQIKGTIRSPLLKTALGGVAVVFPVVGVPALAAVAIAHQSLDAADRSQEHAKKLKRALAGTVKLANAGNPEAKRAVQAFTVAQGLRAGKPEARAKVAGMVDRWAVGRTVASRYRVERSGRLRRVA